MKLLWYFLSIFRKFNRIFQELVFTRARRQALLKQGSSFPSCRLPLLTCVAFNDQRTQPHQTSSIQSLHISFGERLSFRHTHPIGTEIQDRKFATYYNYYFVVSTADTKNISKQIKTVVRETQKS